LLDICKEHALEGVVCKRADSTYRPGRSRSWVKTPIRRKAAVVVIGWTPGRNDALGALLIGAHDAGGNLVYCGTVTSGLSRIAKRRLHEQLQQIETGTPALTSSPDALGLRNVRWTAPQLIGIVEYREFTGQRFHHPSWKGVVHASAHHVPVPPRS
jgi:bifunctional non-homologous end joining protein LigD